MICAKELVIMFLYCVVEMWMLLYWMIMVSLSVRVKLNKAREGTRKLTLWKDKAKQLTSVLLDIIRPLRLLGF